MNITKDEAILFAIALDDFRYKYANSQDTKEESVFVANTLKILVEKLHEAGYDERRQGRTSFNDTDDVIRRVLKKLDPEEYKKFYHR